MADENLTQDEQIDQKELLRQRKEAQIERQKSQYMTDAEEKEEAKIRMEQEKELEQKLAPFVSVRKVAVFLCGFMWLFAVFCLLSGTLEMRLFLPMCLAAVCFAAGINVPIFFLKKQIRDGIISLIAAIVCFLLGILIFVLG